MSDGSADQGSKRNEQEIDSKTLSISYKKYYIDVKENQRGRFIKLTELGTNYRSRLILSMKASLLVRDRLDDILTFIETLPAQLDPPPEKNTIKSELIVSDGRRYYLDLKENERGRFLRITQLNTGSRVLRQQIAIAIEGIVDVREALNELVEKYSEGFLDDVQESAKGHSLTVENKSFYLDLGENTRGKFLRITELKASSGFRTTITLPAIALEKFRDQLDSVIAEVKNGEGEQ